MSTSEKALSDQLRTAEASVFGDVEGKIKQAIAEAVADRRRRGLPIAVAKGDGVELIP